MSYIEREKIFPNGVFYVDEKNPNKSLNELINRICSIPDADVAEVRHGEWRKVNDEYPRYVCTVCNHLFNNKNYNYCPCCGAKMDGERKM